MKVSSRRSLALITTTLLLFTNPALAASYKAECLTDSGEFSSCKVKVGQDRLKVTYQSEHQGSNVDISSEQIVQLFRREYSKEKRRSFLSSALGVAVSSLIPDEVRERMGLSSKDSEENHEQIGVAYVNAPLTAKIREELIRKKAGEDYDGDDPQQVEEEDLEEESEDEAAQQVEEKDANEEDVNQEEYLEEGDTDEDDPQQVEEEDVDKDAEDVKVETNKRKKNLSITLSKNAIIFDVGDEQDAFALRQELKALTGLEFEAE